MEGLSKMEKGLMDMDNSVVIAGGGSEQKGKSTHGHGQQCGDCWGEEGIKVLNGNGKNTIKF